MIFVVLSNHFVQCRAGLTSRYEISMSSDSEEALLVLLCYLLSSISPIKDKVIFQTDKLVACLPLRMEAGLRRNALTRYLPFGYFR